MDYKTADEVINEKSPYIFDEVVEVALEVVDEWSPTAGGVPASAGAASAVYWTGVFVLGDDAMSQEEVAEMFGVSQVTIRNHRAEVGEILESRR